MSNIVNAVFDGSRRKAIACPLFQYDYGQILKISGIELPASYQVHFSNTEDAGVSKTMLGDADGVQIPDEYLLTGEYIYAFIFLHEGEDDGETEYVIEIPVIRRPVPSEETPTPAEQSLIDQLLEQLNQGVEAAEAAADQAGAAAETAVAGMIDDTLTIQGKAADAKKTGDELTQLKSDFTDIKDNLEVLNDFTVTWGQGNIIESTGASGGSAGTLYSKRLRTVLTAVPDGEFSVSLPDNIQMQCFWYAENTTSSYIGCDTLGDISNLSNPRGAYIRFVLAYTDADSAITPRDADVANVRVYTFAYTDTSLTMSGKSADAKTVGDRLEAIASTPIIVDINGAGDYTSFTKAVYEHVNDGRNIIVKHGTYDIAQEYVDLFGEEVVANMTDSTDLNGFQYGVRLINRKVTFESGSHLACDWSGRTVSGTRRFSALAVAYNVEIIGMDLYVKGAFYAIHDDYGTYREAYTNIYRFCRIIGESLYNKNCIGGGCKPYSTTIIDNCYFDNGDATGVCVRYHNTDLSQEAEPKLFVSNSKFMQSISFRYYGTQTTIMRAYVNNCDALSITKGAEGSATVDNVELIKWNNTESA